jgi:hypothetical protein
MKTIRIHRHPDRARCVVEAVERVESGQLTKGSPMTLNKQRV